MRKFILKVTVLSIFISCRSNSELFTNSELIIFKIEQEFLLQSVDKYKREVLNEKENEGKGFEKKLIVILSEDINNPIKTKYIRHVYNDSDIYNLPISGYFLYRNDTILVYSKKHKYMNPWRYSKEFSSNMKRALNDTESKYQKEGAVFLATKDSYIINHSLFWKVEKDTIVKGDRNFNALKLLYGNEGVWGYDFDGKGDSLSIKIRDYR